MEYNDFKHYSKKSMLDVYSNISIEKFHPVYKELAEIIGKEYTLYVYNIYNGVEIRFPKKLLTRESLEYIILQEYTGNNSIELSRKYGYTVGHIRRIIRKSSNKVTN